LRYSVSHAALAGAAGPPVTITDWEASAVHERREQLVEEIRTAERARELYAPECVEEAFCEVRLQDPE